MKLKKAAEILDTHQCDLPRNLVPDLIDAIKLGIEASKEIIHQRTRKTPQICQLLPGETED